LPQNNLILFLTSNQEILWLGSTIFFLFSTILLYRLFSHTGLQAAVVFSILLANLLGPRLITIFNIEISLGLLFYASIFFATDVLSENFGKKAATDAVKLGFIVSLIMIIVMWLSLLFNPSHSSQTAEYSLKIHDAFKIIIDLTPRFIIGSLLAYYVSQRYDVWIFHKIKKKTGENHLWLRNNFSTLSSQFIDSSIYTVVVWWSIVDIRTAIQIGLSEYILKAVIALIDTGFVYWARSSHNKKNNSSPVT
tara:strand:- start:120 stop:869 length:750 start_codon:yes stop_codon:yes gene_type:complete